MSKLRFSLTVLFLCVSVSVTVSRAADEPTNAPAVFPDKNLEAAVRKFVIEKRDTDKPLTESDLANLSTIKGNNLGITNLSGLEKCVNLALLDLANNKITDLSPI